MSKNISGGLASLVIIGFGVVGIFGYQSDDRQTASVVSGESIKVGAFICLTGTCSEWGENSLDGLRMAVDEINSDGGVLSRPVELIVEDSAEDNPSDAVSAYHSLVARGVNFIIGPTWTAAGLAVAPAAADGDVLIMSPSLGVAEFNESADNIFNVWPHDELATRSLARFAYEHGWETAAIFSSKSVWYKTQGNAFEDEFVSVGGVVTVVEEAPVDRMDVKAEAIRIFNTNPEVVVYSNFETMGIMARELRILGYKGPQVSILLDESRLEQAQGAFESAFYVQYEEPADEFVSNYLSIYGKEPGITADTAYDALYVFARAIEDTNSTNTEDVKITLLNFKSHSGASGDFEFDGLGGVIKEPVFWQVKNNEFVKYK